MNVESYYIQKSFERVLCFFFKPTTALNHITYDIFISWEMNLEEQMREIGHNFVNKMFSLFFFFFIFQGARVLGNFFVSS